MNAQRLALLLLLAPLWGLGQDVAPTGTDVLTLEQAISLAMKNNRPVQSAVLSVQSSEEQVAALRTQRLPQFSLSVLESQLLTRINFQLERGQFGIYPGIGPVPGNTTNISTPLRPTTYLVGRTTQPISQLHQIGLGIKSQRVNTDLAREGVRQQRQSLADQVKQVYYSIVQSQSSIDSTEAALKFYQETEALTDRYLVQQTVLKADSLTAKSQVLKARYQLLTLRDTADLQKENLNELMGRDLRAGLAVQELPGLAAYEVDLEGARQRGLSQRADVREARLKVKQAELQERIQRAKDIPSVSLAFNYLSPFNVNFLPKNITSIGIEAQWTPYDWGYKKRELAQDVLARRQADLAARETEQRALLDIDTRFRKLQEARTLVEVNQLSQQAQRERLQVALNQYKERANLLRDVLQEEANMAGADDQYREGLIGFWSAKADLEKSLGEE